MKTLMTPHNELTTHRLDAAGIVLGRLATQAATLLRGKHKPTFVAHLDMGDQVIIVNARKIKLTGRKLEQKEYHRHTGWIGHLKTESMKDLMQTKPEEVVLRAISGMLPRTRLKDDWLKKLTIWPDEEGATHGK